MEDGYDDEPAEQTISAWSASQGEAFMDSHDDEALLTAARRGHQQGGNPLFTVQRERVGEPRSWQNGTVVVDRVRLRLEQNREPNGEILGEAIAEAFRQNARDYVHENRLVPQDCSMRMAIHHSGGTHLWTSCPLIPLTEWMRDSERSREWLDRLAKELNSAEDLDAAGGEFFAELVFVKNRSRAAANGKKYNPRGMSYKTMLKKKKAVVTIKNKDQLRCARAIITMKAKADKDPQYHNILRGRWRQRNLAKTLHKDAEVPEGPCGLEELKKFQRCLGPEYQLIVIERMKGKIIFKERAYDYAHKTITLLKIENHYHGITSIPGFLNRNHFCRHCEKAYNTQGSSHHNCLRQNCPACLRQNKTCPNFATWVTPEMHCDACGQNFYGKECYEAHLQKPRGGKSVCERFKKCPNAVKCIKWKEERNTYVFKPNVGIVVKLKM